MPPEASPAAKTLTKPDKFGIKWVIYPGDTFWQTTDIKRFKLVQRLMETTNLSEEQIAEKIKVDLP